MGRVSRSTLAGRIAAAEALVLAAVTPALLFPATARAAAALAAAVVVWTAYRVANGRWLPPTPLNPILGWLAALVSLSMITTFDPVGSLGKACGVALGMIVVGYLLRHVRTGRQIVMAAWLFAVAGAMLACVGLLGTNWTSKLGDLGDITGRLPVLIRGVPGAEEGFHPNAVAGMLVLFIPVQLGLLIGVARCRTNPRRQRRNLVAALLLVGVTVATLLLTQSRGALAGLATAAVAVMVWHSKAARLLGASLVAGLAIWILASGPRETLDWLVKRSGSTLSEDINGRVEVWSRALYVIRDVPFTGLGLNNFRKVQPIRYPVFLNVPDRDLAHAHNNFLQIGADLGVPGMVVYAALWITLAAMLTSIYPTASAHGKGPLVVGLATGFLAHFTFGLTDAIPLGAKVGVFFWFAVGLIACLFRRYAAAKNPPHHTLHSVKPA